jgi:hypothetical protein
MKVYGLVFFCCCLFINVSSLAQQSEVGFGLGTWNYTGDLVRHYNFRFSQPAATIFYRSNISSVISFRAAFTGGILAASEKPIDPFAAARNSSFNIFLFEASTVMEYHFLNWRDTKKFVRFTPYAFAGLALYGISGNAEKTAEYSNVQGSVPFGLGVKYVYNPKWYFSLEFGARKTFTDYLDNISGGDQRFKYNNNGSLAQYGNPNDKDSYYFLGISITRTFYNIPCPTNPYK